MGRLPKALVHKRSLCMEQNRKEKLVKFLSVILITISVSLIGTIGYGAFLTNSAKNVIEGSHHELESRKFQQKSQLRQKVIDPKVDNISILFLGVDDNGDHQLGSHTRTDAMVVATFNEEDKSVKMVSIPRDARTELVGRNRMDKITHAHAFGGIDMTVQSVEKLMNIPIDYYVRVNFDAFISVVNALDGIEVDVPYNITEQNSERELNTIHIEKGRQTLNGEEALAFARTRKYDSDLDRGSRHVEVIKAIIHKSLQVESVMKYGKVLSSIGDNLTTNLKFEDLVDLHDYAVQENGLKLDKLEISGKPMYIDNIFYYVLTPRSIEQISLELKEHLEY